MVLGGVPLDKLSYIRIDGALGEYTAPGLDVADGTIWSEQARQIRQRADWLAAQPWAKRVTA